MKPLKSLRLRLSQASDLFSHSRPLHAHREASNCSSKTVAIQANIPTLTSPKDSETQGRTSQKIVSYLLEVPPEIRQIIYTYLNLDIQITETIELLALPPYKVRRKYRPSTTITRDYAYKHVIRHRMPAITQVCAQLRCETIAFPGSQCHLILASQSKSRIFTPTCSWINYGIISHIRISQYSRIEMAKIRQHCKQLQSVIVDLEWKPYYQDSEISNAVDKLRQHQARLLSDTGPLTANTDAGADAAGVYWAAIDSFVSTYASELCCLRTDLLVLALDPHRAFELELRYGMVVIANALRRREQRKSLNWDAGEMMALGAPIDYYIRSGRAEE